MRRAHLGPSPRGARRRAGAVPELSMGRRKGGDRVLPVSGGEMVMPVSRDYLFRHLLVAGSTGSGKSTTLLRVAQEAMTVPGLKVHWLDPKPDREFAEEFLAIAEAAGREVKVYPSEAYDAWRGDARAIVNRLMAMIDYADRDAAAYYRDVAKLALQLACGFEEGPPRSSAELLRRLDGEVLEKEYGVSSSAFRALDAKKLEEARLRYETFFGEVGDRFDGSWAWEDADCSYVLLESLGAEENAEAVARMLFADFAHYFSTRKPREEQVMLGVDEFGAISSTANVGNTIQQARVFNAALQLIVQTEDGLGAPEQRDAVLGNVGTVVVHQMPDASNLVRLGGMRKRLKVSHRFEDGAFLDEGSAVEEEEPRVSVDDVGRLAPGEAWVMRRHRAARVLMHRPRDCGRRELPELVEIPREAAAEEEARAEGSGPSAELVRRLYGPAN